ncbi:MAG TPA: hypothetical protein PLT32_01760 [bacterium]|nr:hypothetical protein [bacterium]
MVEVIRSKNAQQKRSSSKMVWLIFGIVVNLVGLFFVIRWYDQFSQNQRPLTEVDEAAFKVFVNQISGNENLTRAERQALKSGLSRQSVEEFLTLGVLSDDKFKNLKSNYKAPAASTTTEGFEDLDGLKIGNSRPFLY